MGKALYFNLGCFHQHPTFLMCTRVCNGPSPAKKNVMGGRRKKRGHVGFPSLNPIRFLFTSGNPSMRSLANGLHTHVLARGRICCSAFLDPRPIEDVRSLPSGYISQVFPRSGGWRFIMQTSWWFQDPVPGLLVFSSPFCSTDCCSLFPIGKTQPAAVAICWKNNSLYALWQHWKCLSGTAVWFIYLMFQPPSFSSKTPKGGQGSDEVLTYTLHYGLAPAVFNLPETSSHWENWIGALPIWGNGGLSRWTAWLYLNTSFTALVHCRWELTRR